MASKFIGIIDAESVDVSGNIRLTGDVTTTNQARTIDFTGFDKEGTTDFSDRAYIQHTVNTGGHSGSVLVISSQNDSGDGIAFATHASSMLKHNGNTIWTAGNDGAGSGLDADTVDGLQASQFLRSDADDTFAGTLTSTKNGTAIVMDGGASAQGIQMTADSSTTYPVFLRATNPGSGGETSPWIYKENNTAWGIWHNNPVNSIDFTRSTGGANPLETNVGGGTNEVMVRIDIANGIVKASGQVEAASFKTGSWTIDQDANGDLTFNYG